MDIEKVLRIENINLDSKASTKEQAIQEIAVNLFESCDIDDTVSFVKCVMEREQLGFTGAGNLVAIPHGISPQLDQIVIAMSRVSQEIIWETDQENIPEKEKRVRFIILFAIPTETEQDIRYIKVLQQICRKLMDKQNIEVLLNTNSKREIIDLFRGKKEK